ncbi:MAG: hypothetical protein QME64_01900, partial [bacterium]|nr:hypothetical protein [bacterium]
KRSEFVVMVITYKHHAPSGANAPAGRYVYSLKLFPTTRAPAERPVALTFLLISCYFNGLQKTRTKILK